MMGEGTVNDQELVEVIAQAHLFDPETSKEFSKRFRILNGRRILAALRSAGFQVFKPEDCEAVDAVPSGGSYASLPFVEVRPGTYFLVPADSGGSG